MAISKHDKKALADLFMHMGVPLMQSVQTVQGWSGISSSDEEQLSQSAKTLSKLLTMSVELATKITKKMEIRDAYTLENVRGRVIRIVTPLIADHYVTNGDIPSEETIESLASFFDILISFSDSVSPMDEKGSKPTKMSAMIGVTEPLLTAITDHNFGKDPQKLFDEVVAGLMGRVNQIAPKLNVENPIEDGLFKVVVDVFVGGYNDKIKTLDEAWTLCDQKLAMVQGLTRYVGDKTGIKGDDVPPSKPAAVVEKKTEAPEVKASPDDKKDAKDSDGDGGDDGDFNPMAFFGAGG